ncbi:hypothetical protein LXL04_038515 [Taraxacum kok-saghyz]
MYEKYSRTLHKCHALVHSTLFFTVLFLVTYNSCMFIANVHDFPRMLGSRLHIMEMKYVSKCISCAIHKRCSITRFVFHSLGSINDINILNKSLIFLKNCLVVFPLFFMCTTRKGVKFGYYLVYEIYHGLIFSFVPFAQLALPSWRFGRFLLIGASKPIESTSEASRPIFTQTQKLSNHFLWLTRLLPSLACISVREFAVFTCAYIGFGLAPLQRLINTLDSLLSQTIFVACGFSNHLYRPWFLKPYHYSRPCLDEFQTRRIVGDNQKIVDWLAETFKRDEGIDLLKDKQVLQRLTETAEKAKKELSTLTQTNIRYQATEWLKSFVGSLGISKQPSEKELISCLRKGLIFCNTISGVQPGSVPKRLLGFHSQSHTWEPIFENVCNLLKAIKGLNLPTLESNKKLIMATLSSISGLASAMGPALDKSSKHVNGMTQIKQATYGNVDMDFVLGVAEIDYEIPSDGSHSMSMNMGMVFITFRNVSGILSYPMPVSRSIKVLYKGVWTSFFVIVPPYLNIVKPPNLEHPLKKKTGFIAKVKAKKDIERTFSALKKCWKILANASTFSKVDDTGDVFMHHII